MSYQWNHSNGWLGLLEHGPVGVTLTDAPYSGNVYENSRRSRTGANEVFDLAHAPMRPGLLKASAYAIARCTMRWALIFTDLEIGVPSWRHELERHGMRYMGTGIWNKTNYTPQLSGDRGARDYEPYLIMHARGRSRWNGGGRGIVEDAAPAPSLGKENGRDVRHPTEKPQDLLERLLLLYSDPGEVVADIFGGRASTGAAALAVNRRFIGWEIDDWFYKQGDKRLAAQKPKPSLLFETRDVFSGDQVGEQLVLDRWAEIDAANGVEYAA